MVPVLRDAVRPGADDVGNWHCPLGIAALSVESVIILLVGLVALGTWQARIHAASVAAARRGSGQPGGL